MNVAGRAKSGFLWVIALLGAVRWLVWMELVEWRGSSKKWGQGLVVIVMNLSCTGRENRVIAGLRGGDMALVFKV